MKKNIKSKQCWSKYIQNLSRTFIPLKDKFLNNTIKRNDIVNFLQNIEDESDENIKTKNQTLTTNSLSYKTENFIWVFNNIIKSDLISCLKNVMIIKPSEIKSKNKTINLIERDYFTDEELDKIVNVYENEKERLIFAFLLSTGIRIGGLLNLKVKDVYDDKLNVLSQGQTLEKYGKIRRFPIFPALKQALELYKNSEYKSYLTNPDFSLFPAYDRKCNQYIASKKSCCQETISKMIKSICKRAKVNGDHIHAHAFRKTVVVKLMSEGNTLDNVSKFIGHSNSSITARHYWTPTQSDLIKNMNMSWLLGGNYNEGSTEYETRTLSTYNTEQIKKITQLIMEGMQAKERLEHALAIMNTRQKLAMEKKWTDKSNENVAQNTRTVISEILTAATTISDISSSIVTQKTEL